MATITDVGLLVEQTIEHLASAKGPAEGWTPVQVLDHLSQVHTGVLLGLRSQVEMPRRHVGLALRRRIVNFLMLSAIPVPARGALPACPENADFEAAAAKLRKLQAKLEKRIDEGVQDSWVCFVHPVGGPLNLNETLAFVHAHLMYHCKRAGK
ncbi:MAG: DinB family protein [Armatimonadota bacterium]